MKLSDKFSFDPPLAFETIEQEMAAMRAQVRALQDRMAAAGGDGLDLPAPVATQWQYDVGAPVFFTDNLFDFEPCGETGKRWVGPDPALSFHLRLRRDMAFRVELDVVDVFPGTVFRCAVDGQEVPFQLADRVLWFDAPQSELAFLRGDGLGLSVAVGPETLRVPEPGASDSRTLAFSLSAIRVAQVDQ